MSQLPGPLSLRPPDSPLSERGQGELRPGGDAQPLLLRPQLVRGEAGRGGSGDFLQSGPEAARREGGQPIQSAITVLLPPPTAPPVDLPWPSLAVPVKLKL